MLTALIKTMRPRQWTKNIFIFAALVFDKQLFIPLSFVRTLAGFALFCLISSCVYIVNDLADVEADRRHPEKKYRPIPSGVLSVRAAWAWGSFIALFVFVASYFLAPTFCLVVAIYFVLNLAYSLRLKHVPILDVLLIAAGFVLRVAAGVTLIRVERFSPWLYIVMFLLSLFLGFGKRRAELALLAQDAGSHRKVLDGYTLSLLDQYILIVSATTIVAYSLYTFSAPNVPENHSLMLTIPFMVYSIFRYLYLVEVEHAGGAPEDVLLSDRPFQLSMALWAASVVVIFYFV
ncbi:MAG: decaprenyl-phosphate phosphoribosyltransferase [Anaerolineales bacterium]|nr:decaprenyl-phosphate phosphoribosyltransferase [Anaerolineales bacterium]